ncbi:hypothetical protein B0T10DRAFT_575797 [Thelonectria olida]|uniref:Uncharacterized protein n=1 Tax=Thelonectria olida TaxID=1576542 RepID=A0A9P9AMA1_9HYPO|nr:hypothetical protein B0T10DRAFT_575797 [Thelonectria olida]
MAPPTSNATVFIDIDCLPDLTQFKKTLQEGCLNETRKSTRQAAYRPGNDVICYMISLNVECGWLASEDTTEEQRTKFLHGDPWRSQFPMRDYAFIMQEISAALGLAISPPAGPPTPPLPHNKLPLSVLAPSRYLSPLADENAKADNARLLHMTNDVAIAGLTTPRFIARAAFRSLPNMEAGAIAGQQAPIAPERAFQRTTCASTTCTTWRTRMGPTWEVGGYISWAGFRERFVLSLMSLS